RVALYRLDGPGAPCLLDASGLVASGEPDARGRFSFSGLGAGRYCLVAALPDDAGSAGASVSGPDEEIVLDARRPAVVLPPLALRPR
ncbi:MAG: hypothetical protein KGM24_05380, partial [Elusimicrobia bacterium]|nr:hypothetical protein [Elusimicrobiota bacterium]